MYQTVGVALGLLASVLYFNPDMIMSKLPKNETTEKISKKHQETAFLLAVIAIYLYVTYPDTLTLDIPTVPSIKTPSTSSKPPSSSFPFTEE
ncbi:MAG: hypothetical protein EB100_03235 [Crocinitomicaceae bacterium]|nr:hypothetical protein [Crocinitomicaceae bacterium]